MSFEEFFARIQDILSRKVIVTVKFKIIAAEHSRGNCKMVKLPKKTQEHGSIITTVKKNLSRLTM